MYNACNKNSYQGTQNVCCVPKSKKLNNIFYAIKCLYISYPLVFKPLGARGYVLSSKCLGCLQKGVDLIESKASRNHVIPRVWL